MVHQRDAGPGVFAKEMKVRGVELDQWLIAKQPEPPADPAGYDAVMTFGGAMNTHEENRHPWLRREKELLANLLDGGMPLLGACLGTQLLAEAAGAGLEDAARMTIYLTEMESFPAVNEVYAEFFSEPFPVRSTIGVAALPKGALVEIDATVPLGGGAA